MEPSKTFKTKTGNCHIYPDKIVLTKDGRFANIGKGIVGESMVRGLLIVGAMAIGLFYYSVTAYQASQFGLSVLYGLFALWVLYGMVTSLNGSLTPVIDRMKIKEVRFKRAITGITRSRFEVMFEDENQKIKKRMIMLPGLLTNGKEETERALRIMQEEQLLSS